MTDAGDRYARQILLPGMGPEGQRRLEEGCVAVVGLGALGTVAASYLARAGVGEILLIDRDVVEWSNLHRQLLYTEEDARLGMPKAMAAAARLAEANASIRLQPQVADLTPANIDALLEPAAVIVDGTDNFETRYLVNEWCVRGGRPWIYGAAVGTYGMTFTVRPGATPCLACLFPTPPPAGESPTCETAGILGPASGVIAALQAGEALRLLAGVETAAAAALLSFDLWTGQVQRVVLEQGPSAACDVCGARQFPLLEARAGSRAARLCGRHAVQVTPVSEVAVDLPSLARRLGGAGEVTVNPYLVRFHAEECEVTVFADGRSLVRGTDDPTRARTLVSRFVGA